MTRKWMLSSGGGLWDMCDAWTTVGLLLHPWANPMIALASRCVNRAAHILITWPPHLSPCNTIHTIKKSQVCVCLGMRVCFGILCLEAECESDAYYLTLTCCSVFVQTWTGWSSEQLCVASFKEVYSLHPVVRDTHTNREHACIKRDNPFSKFSAW